MHRAESSAASALFIAKHLSNPLSAYQHDLVFSIFMQGSHRVCAMISLLLFIADLLGYKNLGPEALASREDVTDQVPRASH